MRILWPFRAATICCSCKKYNKCKRKERLQEGWLGSCWLWSPVKDLFWTQFRYWLLRTDLFGLKKGDKVIFWQDGGVFDTAKGRVYTFERWFDKGCMDKNDWWYTRLTKRDDCSKTAYNYRKYFQTSEDMERLPHHCLDLYNVRRYRKGDIVTPPATPMEM